METFICKAAANHWSTDFTIYDIPLIAQRDSLLGRWWNRFHLARRLQNEVLFWSTHGLMVPSDSFDTALIGQNVPYLREVYSGTPTWWSAWHFPLGVNIPTPPVVYYYHHRMMAAATEEERAFWDWLLQL